MSTNQEYSEAYKRLDSYGQGHVLEFWNILSEPQRTMLLRQIRNLDLDAVNKFRGLLKNPVKKQVESVDVAPATKLDGDERDHAFVCGEGSIRNGNVGVVVVAGGQGSRLGFEGPKGVFVVGPVSDASLFQIHARKILALERKYNATIPFYIMTTETNDADIRKFFDADDCFGLNRERVYYFTQGMWPSLTERGCIILDRPDHIFMSPDGHGGVVSAMKRGGIFANMKERGVRSVFYFQVDNPMLEIADPAFIGFHELKGAEISMKVFAKRDAFEPVGVVVSKNGRNAVVEYTELTNSQRNETLPEGGLKFMYGSPAIHVIQRSFFENQAENELPIHVAYKKIPYCDRGKIIFPNKPNAYKFEKFIFDVIPRAKRSYNLVFAREDEFSPVKNASGEDSLNTARRDMTMKYVRWLEQCGVKVPKTESGESVYQIEIDPVFALTSLDLNMRISSNLEITKNLLLT